jgi:capsular exopolysaccharide synthesis family protein
MSYIFDALQKAESERSGAEVGSLAAADLLQIRENEIHAVDEIGKSVVATAVANLDRSHALELEAAPVTEKLPSTTEVPASVVDQFSQFQTLKILVGLQSRLVSLIDKDSLTAEKFRFVAVRLRQLRQKRLLKKVLITSSIPQEGKSMVAANLACTLARRTQQKTLLIDGDLRRPSLSKLFGLGKVPGLCEWLHGDGDPTKCLYQLEGAGLCFLPAGDTPNNPLELMQSGKLSLLLDQLTAWFDWVVIDSPPALPLADTSVWTRLADGILMVVRQGTTEKRQLQRVLEVVDKSKLIGALLNSATDSSHNDYYYHYKNPSATQNDKPIS